MHHPNENNKHAVFLIVTEEKRDQKKKGEGGRKKNSRIIHVTIRFRHTNSEEFVFAFCFVLTRRQT